MARIPARAFNKFSYMMLLTLAGGTCGGLGFLIFSQRTGQFGAPARLGPRPPAPHRRPPPARAEPIKVEAYPYERKQGQKKFE